MTFLISNTLAEALDDHVALRCMTLEPLDEHLGTTLPLRRMMARTILQVMEFAAIRRHIDAACVAGFTTALRFLSPTPTKLPGTTEVERQDLALLFHALCAAPFTDDHVPLRSDAPAHLHFAATCLAAARAMNLPEEENDEIATQGARLSTQQVAIEFLHHMHARLHMDGLLPSLSASDRTDIRMVLDIVETHLPTRRVRSIMERVSPEGRAFIEGKISGTTTVVEARAGI